MRSAGAKRRHWVTTLLAVWMFADALWLLLREANHLYTLWEFHHRPHVWPPAVSPRPNAGFWLTAIYFNFERLLRLFPVPHLLLVVRQTALFRMLDPGSTNSNALDSAMNLALFGIALAMGYGLLRMREWARWNYAALCVLSLLLFQPWGFLFFFLMIANVAIPIALLVFLFRHGLAAKPRMISAPVAGALR
jgi:hypothetical protein